MGGAGDIPTSVAELDDYLDAMRPQLALNEQTLAFIDFVLGRPGTAKPAGALEQRNRELVDHVVVRAGAAVGPPPRRLRPLRARPPPLVRAHHPLNVALLNWAIGTPVNRRLAEARRRRRRRLPSSTRP